MPLCLSASGLRLASTGLAVVALADLLPPAILAPNLLSVISIWLLGIDALIHALPKHDYWEMDEPRWPRWTYDPVVITTSLSTNAGAGTCGICGVGTVGAGHSGSGEAKSGDDAEELHDCCRAL